MQGKNSTEQSAESQVYVGIDVCKAWLDVFIHPVGRNLRITNDRNGLKKLKRELAHYDVACIVTEATGKYHRQAHRSLHEGGFAVTVVNPIRFNFFRPKPAYHQ